MRTKIWPLERETPAWRLEPAWGMGQGGECQEGTKGGARRLVLRHTLGIKGTQTQGSGPELGGECALCCSPAKGGQVRSPYQLLAF